MIAQRKDSLSSPNNQTDTTNWSKQLKQLDKMCTAKAPKSLQKNHIVLVFTTTTPTTPSSKKDIGIKLKK